MHGPTSQPVEVLSRLRLPEFRIDSNRRRRRRREDTTRCGLLHLASRMHFEFLEARLRSIRDPAREWRIAAARADFFLSQDSVPKESDLLSHWLVKKCTHGCRRCLRSFDKARLAEVWPAEEGEKLAPTSCGLWNDESLRAPSPGSRSATRTSVRFDSYSCYSP